AAGLVATRNRRVTGQRRGDGVGARELPAHHVVARALVGDAIFPLPEASILVSRFAPFTAQAERPAHLRGDHTIELREHGRGLRAIVAAEELIERAVVFRGEWIGIGADTR